MDLTKFKNRKLINSLKVYLSKNITDTTSEEEAIDILSAIVVREVYIEDLTKSYIDDETPFWIYNDKFYSTKKLLETIIENEELDFKTIKNIIEN